MNSLKEQIKTGKLFKEKTPQRTAEDEFDFIMENLQLGLTVIVRDVVREAERDGLEITSALVKKMIKGWL